VPVSGSRATTKSCGPRSLARRNVPEMQPPPEPPVKRPSSFGQAARDDETFLIIDLKDVVQDFQIHGRRKKILTDAFHDVRLGLDGLPGLDEIVVERAKGIDANDFDAGIFSFRYFPTPLDGTAGAHTANKMGDFAFAVFPNFGAVVR